MRIIGASFKVLFWPDNPLELIEQAGRTCYKSEASISPESSVAFAEKIRSIGHESVIEHVSASVRFVFDRGVSHEMVRHRLCAFSQESTRYCNYSKDRFGNQLAFVKPCFWDESTDFYDVWYQHMVISERTYLQLIKMGAKPQEARSVLPNSLKTEIVVTANFREWRHIFRLRTSQKAHPQMREAMVPCFDFFNERCPEIFGDIVPFRG